MARFWFRIGVCTTIIGLCIFFSNIATQGPSSTVGGQFSTGPNGTWAELYVPLLSGSKEIRINVPRSFEGTLYIFDYEGTKRLVEDGIREPILEENFKGSTLVDFALSRRGAYTIVIESHVPQTSQGTTGIVQKGGIKADMLQDSAIVILVGLTISGIGGALKIIRSHKPTHNLSQKQACALACLEIAVGFVSIGSFICE